VNLVRTKIPELLSSKYLWVTCVGAVCLKSKVGTAYCAVKLSHKQRSPVTRDSNKTDKTSKKQAKIELVEFFKFLWPDIWLLVLASFCAFGVAVVNVKLPLLLGDLVNAVSSLSNGSMSDYVAILREPARKLVSIYITQGVLTFVYISLLSSFGERLAARLRNNLFTSLVKQDVQFFDAHKTGELISRYCTFTTLLHCIPTCRSLFLSHPIIPYPILPHHIPCYPILPLPLSSYTILSHPIPSYPILPHCIPSYPILPHPFPFYLILFHPISFYPILSHYTPSYPILPHPIPFYPTLSHPTPSYSILPHPIPSYPILSHSTPSYPILPHPIPFYPHPIPFYPTLSHHVPFYPILFHSTHPVPSYPILPRPILPHPIPFYPILPPSYHP
jgi:hypothetical protein